MAPCYHELKYFVTFVNNFTYWPDKKHQNSNLIFTTKSQGNLINVTFYQFRTRKVPVCQISIDLHNRL